MHLDVEFLALNQYCQRLLQTCFVARQNHPLATMADRQNFLVLAHNALRKIAAFAASTLKVTLHVLVASVSVERGH